ncbi:MAG: hypothetical protein J4F31_08720 [Flavobacteriales bacterium]|nr:hypothetical protein [Flavobacteriales bacterium]
MENIKWPILLATGYLGVYAMSPYLNIPAFTSLLFILSLIPVFWMVYKVLKDGVESDKHWDEGHFYDHP